MKPCAEETHIELALTITEALLINSPFADKVNCEVRKDSLFFWDTLGRIHVNVSVFPSDNEDKLKIRIRKAVRRIELVIAREPIEGKARILEHLLQI